MTWAWAWRTFGRGFIAGVFLGAAFLAVMGWLLFAPWPAPAPGEVIPLDTTPALDRDL